MPSEIDHIGVYLLFLLNSPKGDFVHDVPGMPKVKRFRSKRHNSFIGDNGAIEIRNLDGIVEFSRPGADGRRISDS